MAARNPKVMRKLNWLFVAVLLWAAAARAQQEIGNNLKLNLNGSLGAGYNGSFGNADLASSHSQGFTGTANLTGYYFNPNFLSFQFRPYYDRNQANSESQSITRGTGFGGSVSLFGGSHFPGSLSLGKDFSSSSEFRIAGVPSISADSSGKTFAISWSALVPNWPTLAASYSTGSSKASYLESMESESSSKNLNLNSGYQILGFQLHGNVSHLINSSTSPVFLTSETLHSGGTGTSYNATAQHGLPLRGAIGLGWSHSSFSNDDGSEWDTTSYSAGTSFTPWHRLSLFQNANYVTDLAAAFGQSVLNGAIPANLRSEHGSAGVAYSAGASYLLGYGITVGGHFTHRVQWYAGTRYEDTQYGGNLNYNHASRLFGFLYFGFGLVDTASKVGNQGLGFNANIGMNRKLGRWDTAADITYSQNVQTLIGIATTSSYSYGISARRKINNELNWGGAFRASHSGMVMQEGTGNGAESFSSSLHWRRYNFGASYSQSSGTAIFSSTGELTASPLAPLITNDFMLFNARSLAVNISTSLFRRMSLGGGYARFTSSTTRTGADTFNTGERYNVRTEYRLRSFSLICGFNRSTQEVSTVAGGPRVVNAYYASFSRWFNVF
ncbi:MAG TPA: hypothetical protein VF493_17550 [Terriglobales bacterium]